MTQTDSGSHRKLPDVHQNFWQLSAIQLTGVTSLPVLATSILILQNNSFQNAVLTLILGNILLWVIRFWVICTSYDKRKSTLDVTRDYFGRIGSYFIAILLLASTLAWFIVQTTLASDALTKLMHVEESSGIDRFIQTSVLIGILSTLFCMNGIVILRKLSVFSLPIILISFMGVLFTTASHPQFVDTASISFFGLPLVLGTSLGVTADLPTFFRHSNSKRHSIIALTIIQIVSFLIGIGGLFLGTIINPWLGINDSQALVSHGLIERIFLILLILFSVICANVANVYSASVGWELVAPAMLIGRKEYLILGLGLTTIFILVANIFSMNALLTTTDNSLVNLCIIFVIGYLISKKRGRFPNSFEQSIYFIAWLVATSINTMQFFNVINWNVSVLTIAVGVILGTIVLGMIFQALLHSRFSRLNRTG